MCEENREDENIMETNGFAAVTANFRAAAKCDNRCAVCSQAKRFLNPVQMKTLESCGTFSGVAMQFRGDQFWGVNAGQ